MQAQLEASKVSFAFGPQPVLHELSIVLSSRERIAIVGPNGSGKSSLLRLLSGDLEPSAGLVVRRPRSLTVGLLEQRVHAGLDETVGQVVARRCGHAAVQDEFDRAVEAIATGLAGSAERYDKALGAFLDSDAPSFDERLARSLVEHGLDRDVVDRPFTSLSGGQQARVALVAIMLSTFDILLLDEPTNDLDREGLELLESFVLGSEIPMAIVSHDRAFLASTATAVVEITPHDQRATYFRGGLDSWLAERHRAQDLHERAYNDFQSKRVELAARVQRQRQWSDRGASKARRSGEGDKHVRSHQASGSESQAAKAKQAQRALARLERDEAVEAPWKPWELQLEFEAANRGGDIAAELRDAVVDRGSFQFGPVTCTVRSGDRILLSGLNGVGKTTLIRALLGTVALTSGSTHLGPSVSVGLLTQRRTLFAEFGDVSMLDAFVAAAGCSREEARSQLAKLGLDTQRIGRNAESLTLGEHTRAALGLFAMRGTNLLVVDEPTNHLDLPGIEALEEALRTYPHTLIVVSHDRRFVERITFTRYWEVAVEADGDSTRRIASLRER